MTRLLSALAAFLMLVTPANAAKLTVKVEDAPTPTEVGAPIRALLDGKALSVLEDGNLLCTIWLRKEFESKATPDQIKAGLTYRELEESVVVGVVRFPKVWTDFRKQKIKAGVYTLRLGWQPMDGDHMGTAPYNEFCLLTPAAKDQKPDALDPKVMHEHSATAVGANHPGVMLLFPLAKPPAEPVIEPKPNNVWVVSLKRLVTVAGQKADLGFSMTVVGHTSAE